MRIVSSNLTPSAGLISLLDCRLARRGTATRGHLGRFASRDTRVAPPRWCQPDSGLWIRRRKK
jgi:hypothetical protein